MWTKIAEVAEPRTCEQCERVVASAAGWHVVDRGARAVRDAIGHGLLVHRERCEMEAPLMFEVLMYLNSYYFGMFSIFEFSVICAKSIDDTQKTHFSGNELGTSMTVFVFLCLIEVFRTFLSRRDNAADKAVCVVLSLILTVPSAVGVLYFLLWQQRTFQLENILGCIQLVLQATQVFFGIVSLLTFKSSDSTT